MTKLLKRRIKQFNDAKKIKKAKNNLVFYDRGIQEIFGYLKAIGLEKSSWKKKLTDYRYDIGFYSSALERNLYQMIRKGLKHLKKQKFIILLSRIRMKSYMSLLKYPKSILREGLIL